MNIEMAWLAGVLEGDGSFELAKAERNPEGRIPTIRLAMLDKDVVGRAAQYFNSNVNSYLTPKGDKTMWRTRISRRATVQPFLLEVYSLMGDRRKEQISKMLNFYMQNPVRDRASIARARAGGV